MTSVSGKKVQVEDRNTFVVLLQPLTLKAAGRGVRAAHLLEIHFSRLHTESNTGAAWQSSHDG